MAGRALHGVWQATALSLAAQVATFPLGLFYFHQFPLSFLLSNLVAVPVSSTAVYVGLGLLVLKGVTALISLFAPSVATALNWGLVAVAWVFETLIRWFNDYIFWIGRLLPDALITGIHVTAPQAWLIFAVILALLAFFRLRQLVWLGLACGLLSVFAGSRVWAAHQLAPDERLIVYSIPRRSVVGFWQGPTAEIVSADSLPLSETELTYRIVPGTIEREARRVSYHTTWRSAPVPAVADTAAEPNLVLAVWRGARVAFVAGRLARAWQPVPVDVLVLRRNARVGPEDLTVIFGKQPVIVFDSSCRAWYVSRLRPKLQTAGWQTHDVTMEGAFVFPLHGAAE
jgi:competence protein ComEC